MKLRVGSTFSGVGGMDLGLERAGMTTLWQVEILPRARAVLRKRFPHAQLHNDVTKVVAHELATVDVLTGGFPCQDLSVAGKRAGLAGERSGLFYTLADLADSVAPEWLLFENVPGLLSACGCPECHTAAEDLGDGADDEGAQEASARIKPNHRGRDFANVLARLCGLDELDVPVDGWRNSGICVGPLRSVAWRVLDARHFGVPQRRRRVFLVGHPRAECAFAVLFESESGEWDPAASSPSGQDAPDDPRDGLAGAIGSHRSPRNDLDTHGAYIPNLSPTVSAKWRKGTGGPAGDEIQNLVAPLTPWDAQTKRIHSADGQAPSLASSNQKGGQRVAYVATATLANALRASDGHDSEDGTGRQPALVVAASTDQDDETVRATQLIATASVRRLTVTECERLMGFPDGWTCLEEWTADRPYSTALCTCPDGPRYAECGNAVVTNVAEWIGRRIAAH